MFPQKSTHSLSLRSSLFWLKCKKNPFWARDFHKRVANVIERREWDFTEALTGFRSGNPIETWKEVWILYQLLVTAFKTQEPLLIKLFSKQLLMWAAYGVSCICKLKFTFLKPKSNYITDSKQLLYLCKCNRFWVILSLGTSLFPSVRLTWFKLWVWNWVIISTFEQKTGGNLEKFQSRILQISVTIIGIKWWQGIQKLLIW